MTPQEAEKYLQKDPSPTAILCDAIAELPRSYKDLDMTRLIVPAINALPDLLISHHEWQSKYIAYEEPYLMRFYRQFEMPSKEDPNKINKARVNLHYFFGKTDENPCPYSDLENPYVLYADRPKQNPDDPQLYHFHSWAAGFFLFEGGYEQYIGHATQMSVNGRPPVTEKRKHSADDASRMFAFNSPYIWHRVSPQGERPVCTMMVTYMPEDWGQKDPPPPSLRDLETHEKVFMQDKFKQLTRNLNLPLVA